ncbi:MAG: YceI family protein [Planctomycetaceae bacterium]|nr:YceI family protein [Planctomycetaceae bacterium]
MTLQLISGKRNQLLTIIACLCAISLCLCGTVSAQNSQRTGEINTTSSRVYTYVGKTGFGHEHAVIGEIKSGIIQLGAAHNAGEIVFNMTTWKADTPQARQYIGLKGTTSASTQSEVNANMLGAGVLNVRKYPTSTFKISSALPLKQQSSNGKTLYQLDGTFTLHGTSRKIRVIAEVSETNQQQHLRGSFLIKQTDFGITPFSKAFGAVGVTDELKIYGDIYLTR